MPPELLLHRRWLDGLPKAETTPEGATATDFAAARALAARLGDAALAPEIHALALLEGAFRTLLRRYEAAHPEVFPEFAESVRQKMGGRADELTARLRSALPQTPAAEENLLLLAAIAENPAARPLLPLLPIADLGDELKEFSAVADEFFADKPPLPPENLPVPEALRAPARRAPHSLRAQLEYILGAWGEFLGDWLAPLLRGMDFFREAEIRAAAPPPPSEHDFAAMPYEAEAPEAYSPDRDWMPQLVLIAKHTYVWLSQLSARFGRPIHRLDQIPDEALAELAELGITGLWLIGVWERSRASQRIKQMMGDPDALASAYSVYDYRVADDLGGEEALESLRARAARFGIRLGADMVPNHMGIDSPWVIYHPDWFIQVPRPPFPYRYTGPNLSWHPAVEIRIEDGYYDHSDAAVVFEMRDHRDGRTRYIYHGNDGTSIPWNDTAQLNHLLPEVREALIRTILDVARRFPIIRFDAAMTLTQKHYQRLWFPAPGEGGAIPSRTEHGMSRAEFLRHMPREFWREVVERVAAEAPDTLLLAEAFWLLEGYFVRTLGMHRVYNSAFMHMLRDEKNAAYHKLLEETLTFDPRILQRYVNFMSTPDEKPAVVQFGKGDKYFGVATLMATLPGLPMFGHGQIEGLAERYGHEFRAPRTDERRDEGFFAEHRRRLAPLLRRRALFAEVHNFRLYPFQTVAGENPDVFAFSNRRGEERALIVYHNRYAETEGQIRLSAPFIVPEEEGRPAHREALADALGIPNSPDLFVRFRELNSGLWHLKAARELHKNGLSLRLHAYQTLVFVDWEILPDPEGIWRKVYAHLRGAPTPDLDGLSRRLSPDVETAALQFAEAVERAFGLCTPLAEHPDVAAVEEALRLAEPLLALAEDTEEARRNLAAALAELSEFAAWLWEAPQGKSKAKKAEQAERRAARQRLCAKTEGENARVRERETLACAIFPHLPAEARAAIASAWGIEAEPQCEAQRDKKGTTDYTD